MEDLELNFVLASDPAPRQLATKKQDIKGKWTTRVRRSEKSKRKSEKLEVPTVTSNGQAIERPTKRQKINEDLPDIGTRPSSTRISKAKQLPLPLIDESVSARSGLKKQVISSLFSSLPVIESQPLSLTELAKLAPSNAPTNVSFASIGVFPCLQNTLKSDKFHLERPTAIQQLAIPQLLHTESSQDTILQAQTGSGKTIAYLLPIIQDLLTLADQCALDGRPLDRTAGTLAVVLVPTRELAQQVYQVALSLLAFSKPNDSQEADLRETKEQEQENKQCQSANSTLWLVPGLLSGGTTRNHEKARLRKGVPLLIATPGRLIDHLESTSSFRLAGEPISQKVQAAKRRRVQGQDEFAVEDAPFIPTASNEENEEVQSSDEDFTRPTSRSYRSRPLKENANYVPLTQQQPNDLGLRWLVLDEADRLMDMGFEPQLQKIVSQLDQRALASSCTTIRRSVLCSATIKGNVQKLAGTVLKNPKVIRDGSQETTAATIRHTPPSQLSQSYVVVPEKLRFVTLLSLLRQKLIKMPSLPKKSQSKAIVFMSTTDSVDFHWSAFAGMQMKQEVSTAPIADNSLSVTCPVLPNIPVFRLHGNLDLATRLSTLKAFTQSSEYGSVLLCTSVAARGLDIPFVKTVVQFDLPTEGGASEYIHRVGRTARAGQKGEAWAFLLPSETGWVKWVEERMSEAATNTSEQEVEVVNQLKEVTVEFLLKEGFGGKGSEYESRSTDVQMAFERWVEAASKNSDLAKSAFTSHIRSYATHPANEKHMFHVKNIHLGHLAKAFGLREAPKGLGAFVGQAKASFDARSSHASKSSKAKASKPKSSAALQEFSVYQKRKSEGQHEDEESGSSEVEVRRKLPKTGRAIDAKRLKAAKIDASEFNIAVL